MSGAPDRIAVIADIHGNIDALEAVLARIAALAPGLVVNLGDHFSGPLAAGEVAARLMALPEMVCLRGNHDRYLVERDPARMGPSDAVAHGLLPGGALEWIAALPATVRIGPGIFACHATPGSDETYLLERVNAAGEVVARAPGEVARLLEDVDAPLILCAHSHLPRAVRLPDGRRVVNPGSVGCPAYDDTHPVSHVVQTGTPDAVFALLERAGAGWRVTHHHVPYDPARMVALARAGGRDEWARALATGWLDPGPAPLHP